MEQHLTLAEARELTGKSESTIKRKIREVTSAPEHADRLLILPPADEVERRKASREPYAWKVNRSLLLRWFPADDSASKGMGEGDRGGSDRASSDVVIEVLRQQLQSKDQQIETLSKQLDRKDEQIAAQNELLRASNVLMRELQQRLAIAPPKTTEPETVVDSTAGATTASKETAASRRSKSAPKKKRVLFGFLRRSK